MEKARSSHPWIARYCVRTLQLMPTLPPPVAVRWAVSGYPYCGDSEPEHAAEMFVDSQVAREKQRAGGVLARFFGTARADDAFLATQRADQRGYLLRSS